MASYSVDQITKGVAAFLDAEVMPLIESDWKKVLVGAGISIAISKYSAMLPALGENKVVKDLELIDKDGKFDLDTLAAAVKGQVPKDGFTVDVPMVGALRFKAEDIDKLYSAIRAQK